MADTSPYNHTANITLRHSAEQAAQSLPALRAEAEKAVASVLHGDHAQSKPGMGEKFWQYREYVPGDRPQDIDWRQTAKTEHVFIRQREWQTAQTSILWCSQSQSMAFTSSNRFPTKQQTARVLTMALGIMMVRAGEKIGSFCAGKTGRSESALEDLATKLTQDIRSLAPLPDPNLYALPRHAYFFQIGDYLEPLSEIEQNFKQFSGSTAGGCVIQILDPSELELLYNGRVLFRDKNHGKTQRVDNVAAIRAAYQKRIQNHNEALHQLCKEHHWHHIMHRTDQDYAETLSTIWSMISHEHLAMNAGGSE
ncbi:MAG: hypothetical protein CMH27_01455 [Micavibrio sp.]|nr:hypothetical protein [Micavibrio sp.]|tara:strand:+ start:14706 stop:15632 length:927 start_codon:yes stop_codon:yes gene_type:complete